MERSEIRGVVAVFAGRSRISLRSIRATTAPQSPIRNHKSIHVRDIDRSLLIAAALDRGRNSHGFAVFGDGSARNIDAGLAQVLNNRIVRHNVVYGFRVDELFDAIS